MIEIYPPNPAGGPSASGLLAAFKSAKATHCVTVPCFTQFALHQRIIMDGDSGMPSILACTEDQALTTATGLHIGGATPFVMIQNQGFLKCINTLRATCIDSAIPMVFLVGQFGRESDNFDKPAKQSRRSMVRLMEPLLETLNLRYWNIESDADNHCVAKAFEHAKSAQSAAVLLVGRHITWN